jgi:hypothetical protein
MAKKKKAISYRNACEAGTEGAKRQANDAFTDGGQKI